MKKKKQRANEQTHTHKRIQSQPIFLFFFFLCVNFNFLSFVCRFLPIEFMRLQWLWICDSEIFLCTNKFCVAMRRRVRVYTSDVGGSCDGVYAGNT